MEENIMILREEKRDLFTVSNDDYWYAHCISADLGMAGGIAADFNYHFDEKNFLINKYGLDFSLKKFDENGGFNLLLDQNNHVFNLVTKKYVYQKPTYQSLREALNLMRAKIMTWKTIHKIAMPRIGCGIDGLSWNNVKMYIHILFDHMDDSFEILVCVL